MYIVSQKKSPPEVFWHFFPNGWEFLVQILHAYYTLYARVQIFYPRDAMLARVFAIATCLSVSLSVRRAPVLCLAERKQDREMYTIW